MKSPKMSNEFNILKTCTKCKKSFPTLRDLIDHEKSHKLLQSTPELLLNSTNIPEFVYGNSGVTRLRCEYCQFTFTDLDALSEHNKKHEKWALADLKRTQRREITAGILDESKMKTKMEDSGKIEDSRKFDSNIAGNSTEAGSSKPAEPSASTSSKKPGQLIAMKITAASKLARCLIRDAYDKEKARDWWRLQCDHCKRRFETKSELSSHLWRVHKVRQKWWHWPCDKCSKSFKTKKHMDLHKCEADQSSASASASIVPRKWRDRVKIWRSRCTDQSAEVVQVSSIAGHSMTVGSTTVVQHDHVEPSNTVSVQCSPYSSLQVWALRSNKTNRSHPEKRSFCQYCHGYFADLVNLKLHQKRLHFSKNGQHVYFCSKCESKGSSARISRKYFMHEQSLLIHLAKYHGNDNYQGLIMDDCETTVSSKDVDLGWTCEYCYGSFSARDVLLMHKKKFHYPDDRSKIYFCFKCENYGNTYSKYRKDKKYYPNANALKEHYESVHGNGNDHHTSGPDFELLGKKKGKKRQKQAKPSETVDGSAWTVVKQEPLDEDQDYAGTSDCAMPVDSTLVKMEVDEHDGHVNLGTNLNLKMKQEMPDE